jgi:hypothetical protein
MNPLFAFVTTHAWVWPVAEMFHFFGMALLIGTVGLLDLRILGLGKGIPISLLSRLIPIGIAGFAINLLTGVVFVFGDPGGWQPYFTANLAFQVKLVLILLAGINLLAFRMTGLATATENLPADGDAPRQAKLIAAASLALWFAVIYFGRMIMYSDNLLYALGR